MKSRILLIFIRILGCLVLTGCGALINGTTQLVKFDTSPQGAVIKVEGIGGGEYFSPVVLELDRNHTYAITFSKDGYRTEKRVINRKIDKGILILNVLLGAWPIAIDAILGTWYSLSPKKLSIMLRSNEAGLLDIPVDITASEDGSIKIKSSEPVKISIKVNG